MIDYADIVETFLPQQFDPASALNEDSFHPGLLPSVLYVDRDAMGEKLALGERLSTLDGRQKCDDISEKAFFVIIWKKATQFDFQAVDGCCRIKHQILRGRLV